METPSRNDASKNFPGSGNLSDFQIINPIKIGGNIVTRYIKEGSLIINF